MGLAHSGRRARPHPRYHLVLDCSAWNAGSAIDHQTGGHQIWKHPLLPGISAVLAGSDGADARPYQESQLRRILQALREMDERQQR